jgi:hypothetical protein
MSDNKVDPRELARLKIAAKKIISSYSDVFRVVKRIFPDKFTKNAKSSDIIHGIETKVSKRWSPPYLYSAYDHLSQLINRKEENESTGIENARHASISKFMSDCSNIGSDFSRRIRVNTKLLVSQCGYEPANRIVNIPVTYARYAQQIGSLGTNKVLVWAKPDNDPDYKCWKIMYLTYKYESSIKKVKEVECWAMKEMSSGILYFHEDKMLCKRGLRRRITMKISKRMAGSP